MSGSGYTNSAPWAAPRNASMNPMAMLQAYRGGSSMNQLGQMNMPTARPAQYLPPGMGQQQSMPQGMPMMVPGIRNSNGLMGGGTSYGPGERGGPMDISSGGPMNQMGQMGNPNGPNGDNAGASSSGGK